MQDQKFLDHRINSPVHMLKSALRNLNCDVKTVEPNSSLTLDRLFSHQPHLHITDQQLGSAGTRSREQAEVAKQEALQTISEIPVSQPLIFTDGSAMPNPGPCGAAAICYLEGTASLPITLTEPVSQHSTSYHGELAAINLAVNLCASRATQKPCDAIHIFSDCQSAMLSIASADINQSHQSLIDNIQSAISDITEV